jgi:flagellar protein FliO/FliZ
MHTMLKIMITAGASLPLTVTAQANKFAGKFADPAVATTSSGVAGVTQVSFALLLVLAVVFAAAWAMRKFRFFNQRGQTAIEVLQGVNLGAKERAVLIRIQGRRLLLGVAPGQVSLLAELAAEAADVNTESVPGSNPASPSVHALLTRSLGWS